jgi:hypothetical protein
LTFLNIYDIINTEKKKGKKKMLEHRKNYKEMNDLIKLLAKNNIPFEVLAFPAFSALREEDKDFGLQIFAPSYENHVIDAVCHWGTYGYENGLIEIMSDYLDDVEGWLTAGEAYGYFVDAINNFKKEE